MDIKEPQIKSRFLAVCLTLLAWGSNANATTTTITFDELNATGGAITGSALDNYLAQFGVSIGNVTAGSQVEVDNYLNVYGGGGVQASSPPNILLQNGPSGAESYTLAFAVPQTSISFTRPALVAGGNGVSFPQWSATALDASNNVLGSVGESLSAYFSNQPAKTFTLTGFGITAVRFDGNDFYYAGYRNVVIDDLVVNAPVPLPAAAWLFSSGLLGLSAVTRRRSS